MMVISYALPKAFSFGRLRIQDTASLFLFFRKGSHRGRCKALRGARLAYQNRHNLYGLSFALIKAFFGKGKRR